MDEAIDRGEGHCGIGKDLPPFAEWLVGGDEHGPALVACADQLEHHAGLGLILCGVSEVCEDQRGEWGIRSWKRSSRLIAASRSSSRRATWSFCTRSVVRVKRTFHPFSTRARPIAEAR